jgi:hypothetical protein
MHSQTAKQDLPRMEQDSEYQKKINSKKQEYRKLSKLAELSSEYLMILTEKKDLEEELSRKEVSLKALSQMMVEKMEGEDLHSFKTPEGTIYLRSSVYPKVTDKQSVITWIEETGNLQLLGVQHQSLKALCKELLEEGKALPDGVDAFIDVNVGYRRTSNG